MELTACLDPDTLAAYVDGLLADDAVGRADRHIDSCRDCRNELSALAVVRTERSVPAGSSSDAAPALSAIGRLLLMRELSRGGDGGAGRPLDAPRPPQGAGAESGPPPRAGPRA